MFTKNVQRTVQNSQRARLISNDNKREKIFFLLSCSRVAIRMIYNNLKCLLLEDRHKFKKFNFAIKIFNERRKETQKTSVEGRK